MRFTHLFTPVNFQKVPSIDEKRIQEFFPEISRAPPKKVFDDASSMDDGSRYVPISNDGTSENELNQLRPESDDDFNQDINW